MTLLSTKSKILVGFVVVFGIGILLQVPLTWEHPAYARFTGTLAGRPLRRAAESFAAADHGIDVGEPAVHPSGSQRTQPGRGASDYGRVDLRAMPLVGERSAEADQDHV